MDSTAIVTHLISDLELEKILTRLHSLVLDKGKDNRFYRTIRTKSNNS